MSMTTQTGLVDYLESLVASQDRGSLATLRRGLGRPPGETREMDRHVLKFIPAEAGEKQENAYYLVAALFANWYQSRATVVTNTPANLGGSLRALVDCEAAEKGSREEAEKRIEKRLVALLNSHQDDLPAHLRYITDLLKIHDVPVNWGLLLRDIQNWSWEGRQVQRRWAREFWRTRRVESPAEEKGIADNEDTEEI